VHDDVTVFELGVCQGAVQQYRSGVLLAGVVTRLQPSCESTPSTTVLYIANITSADPPPLSLCLPCPFPPPQALRVLLQQRVSAVAVLAGSGPSPNMRLVGNLSASDLRHLRKGGFGGLALSVKAFLASKPLAPDQVSRWVCRLDKLYGRQIVRERTVCVSVLVSMSLVGNLSASDLRHLRKGGFGGLALSVKAFLASKPLAPDQVGCCTRWHCGGLGGGDDRRARTQGGGALGGRLSASRPSWHPSHWHLIRLVAVLAHN
jgi:CBS domain-containing protein